MQQQSQLHVQAPALIRRCDIEQLLGGISRTTFHRRRKEWEEAGTPFPKPFGNWSAKGGALWRRHEVIAFFVEHGMIPADSASAAH
ncbi:MAG: hypothetical protein ACRC9N_10015 [Aeromonas sp.]